MLCDVHYSPSILNDFRLATSYRSFKVDWVGLPNTPPDIAMKYRNDQTVYVSWNGATEVATWTLQGTDSSDWDEDCWTTVHDLAARGILVAPGAFYGPEGGRHVRVALTATDERVDAAVARLREAS